MELIRKNKTKRAKIFKRLGFLNEKLKALNASSDGITMALEDKPKFSLTPSTLNQNGKRGRDDNTAPSETVDMAMETSGGGDSKNEGDGFVTVCRKKKRKTKKGVDAS